MAQLLSGAGDLVTEDMEKAEVPNAFFALVFTEICCLAFEVPGPPRRVCGSKKLPIKDYIGGGLKLARCTEIHGPRWDASGGAEGATQ